ncbi:hypothetical protein ASD85_25580 [Rhizobium sp. Root651]|nr:hypothetical protein ASD85_25580 [Rhizobium sp. Root651]
MLSFPHFAGQLLTDAKSKSRKGMACKVQICTGHGEASLAACRSPASAGTAKRLNEPPRDKIHE